MALQQPVLKHSVGAHSPSLDAKSETLDMQMLAKALLCNCSRNTCQHDSAVQSLTMYGILSAALQIQSWTELERHAA